MKRMFGDGSEGDVVTPGGNQYLGHTKGFKNLEVAAATVYRPLSSIITCKEKFTLKGEIRLKGRAGGSTVPGMGGLSGSKSPDAPPPDAISLANRGTLPWPTAEEDGCMAMSDGAITGKTGVQYGTYNAVPSGDPVPPPCSYLDGTMKFRGNGGIGGAVGPIPRARVTCGDPNFFDIRSNYFKADAVGGVEIALMLNKIFEHAPSFFDLNIAGGLGGGSGDYLGGAEIPGAGGGAGGMVVIIADEIILDAGSIIDVSGGAGENARDPMLTGSEAGGGGGGGGGCIILICNTFTDNGCTYNFAGGAGGNGINGGDPGSAGVDGWKKLVELPQ
jgi:hypothetical protein